MGSFSLSNNKIWYEPSIATMQDILSYDCEHLHEGLKQQLNEYTYKEIQAAIDNNFLKQAIRAAELNGVNFAGIEEQSLLFNIDSSEKRDNGQVYLNVFQMKEWEDYIDEGALSPVERARKLMYEGNLKVHCTCPSFQFHGYKYILSQLDSSLEDEDRYPRKTNPNLRGVVCKHLHRSLKVFPFHTGKFSSYIKNNHQVEAGKTDDKDQSTEMLERARVDPDFKVTYGDIL